MKSLNVFSKSNSSVFTVSGIATNKTPFTMEAHGGIIRLDINRLSAPASAWTKVKNFPFGCRIVNAWFNTLVGAANHSIRISKSASSASVIANIPTVTSASGFNAVNRLHHARATIAQGDTLLVGASGANASAIRGTLFIQVVPT